MQLSFSVLVGTFPVVVMATGNCHGAGVISAQGPLEVKCSTFLGLVGSNQLLFFFSLQLPPET